MSHRLVVVTLVPLIAISSSAVAQPRIAAPAVAKQVEPVAAPAVRVDVGLGSPVGEIGVVYARPLAPHFAVELGAGYGLSGVQLSVMGKGRMGSGRWRFTPGLGLSLGLPIGSAFHEGHPDDDHDVFGDPVFMRWLDADLLGVEYRGPSGFVFSASAGVTVALNRAHYDVIDIGDDVRPGSLSPQARVGFGKTF